MSRKLTHDNQQHDSSLTLFDPQQAFRCDIFAAPALMLIDASGHRVVLYGDLSDAHGLKDLLSAL